MPAILNSIGTTIFVNVSLVLLHLGFADSLVTVKHCFCEPTDRSTTKSIDERREPESQRARWSYVDFPKCIKSNFGG